MKKEFVMRGQTASGTNEVLNFSGYKPGYAFRLVEFKIYPSNEIGTRNAELSATITAAKTAEDPEYPNFDNEGLIATAMLQIGETGTAKNYGSADFSVVNDLFLITQDLIIAAIDTQAGLPMAVNWQCRFVSVKMGGPEEAVTNYKQFTISDE